MAAAAVVRCGHRAGLWPWFLAFLAFRSTENEVWSVPGAAGFAGYPRVVLVAAVWRVLTALAVLPILSCLNKKQSLSELLIFTVDAVAVVWLGNVGTIGNCLQMFADVWTMLVLGSPLHEA